MRLLFAPVFYRHRAPPCRPTQSRLGVFPLYLDFCRRPRHRRVPTDHRPTQRTTSPYISSSPLGWLCHLFGSDNGNSTRATPRRCKLNLATAALQYGLRDRPRTHTNVHPRIHRTHICPRVRGWDDARRHGQRGRVRTLFSIHYISCSRAHGTVRRSVGCA